MYLNISFKWCYLGKNGKNELFQRKMVDKSVNLRWTSDTKP